MSEPIREINGNMVDLPSQINQLESDNAALEIKIKKLKSELNGKLFQQSKDDIRRLNEQLTAYSEKEIASSNRDKSLSSIEIRRDAANKSASRQAGSIFLIALSLAYVALIFFAFGPTSFAYPYLNFLLGIFFALALLLCVYPLLEMGLVSLFAKIRIKPVAKKKKKKVGGQLLKKKGNEPEEAIFIGIND